MAEKGKYYIVRERAVPEVLLKVVEAKRLLEIDKTLSVHEAAEQVESAEVLFINTRMIFCRFTMRQKERR